MSRYPAEHKEKTRKKIVAKAGKLFRQKGYSGAGVQKLMSAAGLTQGGFYAHFPSKGDLLIDVMKEAFDKTRANWLSGTETLSSQEKLNLLIRRFISRGHRDNISDGCPSTCLTNEISRSSKKIKKTFEEEIRKSLEAIKSQISQGTESDRESAALLIIILGLGAITLSRAITDENFSDQMIQVARNAALSASHTLKE